MSTRKSPPTVPGIPAVTSALRTPLRWCAAILLVVTAAVHFPLIGPHLEEAPYIGVLFIVLTVVSLALAAMLVARDSRASWALAGITTLLAVIAFVLARTVGLPQIGDDIGDWSDPLGIAAITAETLTVLIAGGVLVVAGHRPSGADADGSAAIV